METAISIATEQRIPTARQGNRPPPRGDDHPQASRDTELASVPDGLTAASGAPGAITVVDSHEVQTIGRPVRADGTVVNGGTFTLRVGADRAAAPIEISATATAIRDTFTAVYGQ